MKKLTTWEVLRYKFPANEYVLIAEVSDKSGFSRSRSLDYMVINLWESRGLAINGIELKSNRSDWLREIKNPQKQENHFKYCDYFYLLTDKENVAKLEEIPLNWGWYHINEKQILKTMKPAPKLQSVPVERSLLCAMLRRAADKEKFVHIDSIQDKIEQRAETLQERNRLEVERKLSHYTTLKETVDKFEAASGISIGLRNSWDRELPTKTGEIVKMILANGDRDYLQNLVNIEKQVGRMHSQLLEGIALLQKKDEPAEIAEIPLSEIPS